MEMISVKSSNLSDVGYDKENRILYIRFHSGGLYAYYDVPEYEYHHLMSASSHGKYFSAYIKRAYIYKKIS